MSQRTPGFAIGVLTLSGAYRLDELHAGSTIIAIAFSGVAVINVFVAPRIGRASDRLGRTRPIMLALAVSAIDAVYSYPTTTTTWDAVVVSHDAGVMVNEEDHLRLQVFRSGFDIAGAEAVVEGLGAHGC